MFSEQTDHRCSSHRDRAHSGTSFLISLLCLGLELGSGSVTQARAQSGAPQLQTQVQMERIRGALVDWVSDHDLREAPFEQISTPELDIGKFPPISAAKLEELLVPDYLDCLPIQDAWGYPFEFRLDSDLSGPIDPFAIRSPGSDGLFQGDVYSPGYVNSPREDIVVIDGRFIRSAPNPEPVQRTLDEMERIGREMRAWLRSRKAWPTTSSRPALPGGAQVDLATQPRIDASGLEALIGFYLGFLPVVDGWGNPYEFWLDQDPANPGFVAVRSAGSDGKVEGSIYSYGQSETSAGDFVWVGDDFLRRPALEGVEPLKVTANQMIRISGAMLFWAIDQAGQSRGRRGNLGPSGPQVDLRDFEQVSLQDLESLLVPWYLPFLPPVDGWGNPYGLWLDTGDPLGFQWSAVASTGSDGVSSGPVYTEGGFPFHHYKEDLVIVDQLFVRVPEVWTIFADGFECGDAGAWTAIVP